MKSERIKMNESFRQHVVWADGQLKIALTEEDMLQALYHIGKAVDHLEDAMKYCVEEDEDE